MRCDRSDAAYQCHQFVSIPAGFSDALRPCTPFVASVIAKFQSLLGFLMRCDDIVRDGLRAAMQVSIPAGFSDALRPAMGASLISMGMEFQSLLGFLMRCDAIVAVDAAATTMFQSLLGFLMRCDDPAARQSGIRDPVSIPAGFSDALRLHRVPLSPRR